MLVHVEQLVGLVRATARVRLGLGLGLGLGLAQSSFLSACVPRAERGVRGARAGRAGGGRAGRGVWGAGRARGRRARGARVSTCGHTVAHEGVGAACTLLRERRCRRTCHLWPVYTPHSRISLACRARHLCASEV